MPLYTKESLENLKRRIDLIEVVSSHVEMQRAGASYKGCCPFHEEKTPSFVVQKGDSHYHCYGCGAHGDAIAFLMLHLKMSFVEAVESLAEKFQVTLEKSDGDMGYKGPPKAELKGTLNHAADFFHFYLLHSEEGKAGLEYLYSRGMTLEFIRRFRIGFAPSDRFLMEKVLKEHGCQLRNMETSGLLSKTQNGGFRPFFSERILFPILDRMGSVIGFSGRKIREEVFGGKYINTPETPLFKKSRVLYGLYECRSRIAKEEQAVIVEGQIDALRMIDAGLNFTLAGQGTAFGKDHVNEVITLGVKKVFLALDGDLAGREATSKIGDLFLKRGIEVRVLSIPDGGDPDQILRDEGTQGMVDRIENAEEYLEFQVRFLSEGKDLHSPAVKNQVAAAISAQIKEWEGELLIYESLRKLAKQLRVPENVLGVGQPHFRPQTFYKKKERVSFGVEIDPDRVLEGDLLRWLFLLGESKPEFLETVKNNLTDVHFKVPICQKLFTDYMEGEGERDLLTLSMKIEDEKERHWLEQLMQKKVHMLRAEESFLETVRLLLQREWMEKREAIKVRIQSGNLSDEEALSLAKEFDQLKQAPPELVLVEET